MKNRFMNYLTAGLTVLLLSLLLSGQTQSETGENDLPNALAADEVYQCPPCGTDHCKIKRSEPGDCPDCGMKLVKASTVKNVAILVFDGVQIIDFTGPYEVFGQAGFNVFTVAKSSESITTAMSMSVNPTFAIGSEPAPDIVVVPGGHGLDFDTNPIEMAWIQSVSKSTETVFSVCNGAVSIGIAGLLKDKSATTHHGFFDELKRRSPSTTVVRDKKWVDNGDVITSAGLSSGVDASLYLVAKIKGMENAIKIAEWMEYEWKSIDQVNLEADSHSH